MRWPRLPSRRRCRREAHNHESLGVARLVHAPVVRVGRGTGRDHLGLQVASTVHVVAAQLRRQGRAPIWAGVVLPTPLPTDHGRSPLPVVGQVLDDARLAIARVPDRARDVSRDGRASGQVQREDQCRTWRHADQSGLDGGTVQPIRPGDSRRVRRGVVAHDEAQTTGIAPPSPSPATRQGRARAGSVRPSFQPRCPHRRRRTKVGRVGAARPAGREQGGEVPASAGGAAPGSPRTLIPHTPPPRSGPSPWRGFSLRVAPDPPPP